MKRQNGTKEQFAPEQEKTRKRVSELEQAEEERKRAEELVRESEERYRLLFDSAPDSIVVMDTQGIIVECNQSGVLLYGYPKQEMIGKHVTELMHPSSVAIFREKFPQLQRLESAEGEVQSVSSDGSIVEIWRKGIPLTDADGNFAGVLVYDRDITERKLAKEALERTWRSWSAPMPSWNSSPI